MNLHWESWKSRLFLALQKEHPWFAYPPKITRGVELVWYPSPYFFPSDSFGWKTGYKFFCVCVCVCVCVCFFHIPTAKFHFQKEDVWRGKKSWGNLHHAFPFLKSPDCHQPGQNNKNMQKIIFFGCFHKTFPTKNHPKKSQTRCEIGEWCYSTFAHHCGWCTSYYTTHLQLGDKCRQVLRLGWFIYIAIKVCISTRYYVTSPVWIRGAEKKTHTHTHTHPLFFFVDIKWFCWSKIHQHLQHLGSQGSSLTSVIPQEITTEIRSCQGTNLWRIGPPSTGEIVIQAMTDRWSPIVGWSPPKKGHFKGFPGKRRYPQKEHPQS